jgi:hypothetical protein
MSHGIRTQRTPRSVARRSAAAPPIASSARQALERVVERDVAGDPARAPSQVCSPQEDFSARTNVGTASTPKRANALDPMAAPVLRGADALHHSWSVAPASPENEYAVRPPRLVREAKEALGRHREGHEDEERRSRRGRVDLRAAELLGDRRRVRGTSGRGVDSRQRAPARGFTLRRDRLQPPENVAAARAFGPERFVERARRGERCIARRLPERGCRQRDRGKARQRRAAPRWDRCTAVPLAEDLVDVVLPLTGNPSRRPRRQWSARKAGSSTGDLAVPGMDRPSAACSSACPSGPAGRSRRGQPGAGPLKPAMELARHALHEEREARTPPTRADVTGERMHRAPAACAPEELLLPGNWPWCDAVGGADACAAGFAKRRRRGSG